MRMQQKRFTSYKENPEKIVEAHLIGYRGRDFYGEEVRVQKYDCNHNYSSRAVDATLLGGVSSAGAEVWILS
jgi:hypothetical protein